MGTVELMDYVDRVEKKAMSVIQSDLHDQRITLNEANDRTLHVKFRTRGMKRRLELLAQKPKH